MEALQPGDPVQAGKYRLLDGWAAAGWGGWVAGGRLVAVKLIRAELAASPGFRARFGREVVAARRVSGSFTAPVVDADPGRAGAAAGHRLR